MWLCECVRFLSENRCIDADLSIFADVNRYQTDCGLATTNSLFHSKFETNSFCFGFLPENQLEYIEEAILESLNFTGNSWNEFSQIQSSGISVFRLIRITIVSSHLTNHYNEAVLYSHIWLVVILHLLHVFLSRRSYTDYCTYNIFSIQFCGIINFTCFYWRQVVERIKMLKCRMEILRNHWPSIKDDSVTEKNTWIENNCDEQQLKLAEKITWEWFLEFGNKKFAWNTRQEFQYEKWFFGWMYIYMENTILLANTDCNVMYFVGTFVLPSNDSHRVYRFQCLTFVNDHIM